MQIPDDEGGMFSPNMPSDEGERIGALLAPMVAMHAGPESCETCAFRLGTFPNRCLSTVCNALESVATGEPFMCHENMRDGEPTKACAGWVRAHAHFDKADDEMKGLIVQSVIVARMNQVGSILQGETADA